MNFIKYPSLENHYRKNYLFKVESSDAISGEWVATEKLHGANFSLWTDGVEVKAARRSGFIPEDESFYGHKPVLEKYKPLILELYGFINKPFVLFGELVGEGIQKGVSYCEGKDFYVFDIATVVDEQLIFADFSEANVQHLESLGFKVVPILGRGTYEQILAIDNLFNSTFGEFTAEGYVAKPVVSHTLSNGSRVGIKSKNQKFSERKSPSRNSEPTISDEIKSHVEKSARYITDNRFDNVLSKEGEFDQKFIGKYIGLLVHDAFSDYIKDEGVELEDSEIKKVKKMLSPFAREIILSRM